MKKNYIFTLLLTLSFSLTSIGQTTVFQESFETGNSGTPSETCNDNSGDFFTRTDGSDINSSYEVSGQDGNFFFAAMDTDGTPCSMSTQTLLFDDINISSKTDLTLALLLAEDQPSDGKFDWDGGDLFYIEVDYDNSGTFTKVLQFATSASTGFNVSAPMQDTDFDGVGDGEALTNVFSEFTLSLSTGNLVDIRLVFVGLAAGDEDIAVDNIRVIDGFVATPSLSFTSPTNNQVFSSDVGNIPVNFNISNFTLSGDNGSEMTDSTGDGYILGSLSKNGVADGTVNIFSTTGPEIENAEPGATYVVTAELVNNAGTSLSPKVEASVTFSVDYPCNIDLGTFSKTCNIGVSNTYDISIPFTGGKTSTYIINTDSGTLGGDDPTTNESGTITITGVAESTDVAFTLKGDASNSNCDFSINITSPICVKLPLLEAFDYTENTNLISNDWWQDASTSGTPNDIQVKLNDDGFGNPKLGSYYGPSDLPAFTGNMISMSGGGSDPFLGFEDQTSGTVYASFTFHVTDMTGFTKTAGGYFAILGDTSFRARLWIKDTNPGEGLTYHLGLSTSGATTFHTGFTANLAEPVFVVMSYNLDNDEVKLWTVPSETSFGTNTPPAANVTLTGNGDAISRFTLRQDSTSETPFMDIDELRIGKSWADVTSNPVVSVERNSIEGFATYPNPVSKGSFTLTTNSIDTKQVSIFNVLGKQVLSTSFSGTKSNVDVTPISSGIYILKVTENGKTATKKLVIR